MPCAHRHVSASRKQYRECHPLKSLFCEGNAGLAERTNPNGLFLLSFKLPVSCILFFVFYIDFGYKNNTFVEI